MNLRDLRRKRGPLHALWTWMLMRKNKHAIVLASALAAFHIRIQVLKNEQHGN